MKYAVVLAIFLISFPATADEPERASSQRNARSCGYTNFVIFRDHPEYHVGKGLASEAVTWEVEDVFANALESVGFDRVGAEQSPWLILRAVLVSSHLRAKSVSGVVIVTATANLNRDLAFEASNRSAPPKVIEIVSPIEIKVRPGSGALSSMTDLQKLARGKAQLIWDEIEPRLSALCAWKKGLIEDGLTIEELQRELVDGLIRIRREYRERKQGGIDGAEAAPVCAP